MRRCRFGKSGGADAPRDGRLDGFGGVWMFRVESPDFRDGEQIPERFTCEGENLSPRLRWSGEPLGTRSYALVVEDPDAPMGTFVHWVVYDIPGHMRELPGGASPGGASADGHGVRLGVNDFGRTGYGGPCPPKGHGRHRYVFVLRALDVDTLGVGGNASKAEVERAMRGHVLAEGTLTALFER